MFLDPATLRDRPGGLDTLEEIEKASLRMVTQAMVSFSREARAIFAAEPDKPQDIAEDITREAMDTIGVSRIPTRLFGTMDYKRARYIFHPAYAVRQALLVDSKAEKGTPNTATLQVSQTSLRIRQIRATQQVDVPGMLPPVITLPDCTLLTTTVVVKFAYAETGGAKTLTKMRLAFTPNGFLQDRYNPTAADSIWLAGRDAPTLGEDFRVRLDFNQLKQKAAWRVQDILLAPERPFEWSD